MTDPYNFPKVRWPIDISIQEYQGQSVLVLTCPLGVASQPLALIPGLAPVLREFTGSSSFDELVRRFSDIGLTSELLRELVVLLDSSLFLESPNFHAAKRQLEAGYHSKPIREPAFAGLSYSADSGVLASQLASFIGDKDYKSQTGLNLIGLVAPHIDYRRGGSCYGIAYGHLSNHSHGLYILLGTSHQYSDNMFHLTKKHFATPLGTLKCDIEFIDKLSKKYGKDRSFADEFLHKKEHSLELQAPFLCLEKSSASIAPILVGSFYQMLREGKQPSDYEKYERFVEALAEVVAERLTRNEKVAFIASVDMAHVGQVFGDEGSLTPEKMNQIEERDMLYLQAIKDQDKEEMYAHIAEDYDSRRVCGFPTMYLLIDILNRLGVSYTAETYDYQQAVNYESDCAVTFAAMGLYVN